MNNIIRFFSGRSEVQPDVYWQRLKILSVTGLMSFTSLLAPFHAQAFVSKDDINPQYFFNSQSVSGRSDTMQLDLSLNRSEPVYDLSEYTSLDMTPSFREKPFREKQSAFSNLTADDVVVFTIGEAVLALMSYGAAVGEDDAIGGLQIAVGILSYDGYTGGVPVLQNGFIALGAYNLINDVKKERDADGDRKIDEEVFMINFIGMNLIALGEYTKSMWFGDDSNQSLYFYPDRHGTWFMNYRYEF
ncbi:hypothetical protein SBX64_12600 [Vibrio rhizosphaerae]|uniref:Uncharacterized protein n=1 Tax=Vibrio rhizosphaerae TaxID=398736 RepID=A0ABU4IW94_9VIBR|nr:hypothetical protein [Vibrio rhizosphaerae]MDW6093387.1 hypothetical protein [Vibrio rhizosphaerae]